MTVDTNGAGAMAQQLPGPEVRQHPAAAVSGRPVLGLPVAAVVAGVVLVNTGTLYH